MITSIPAAFLGGYVGIDASIYKKVLGVVLAFAILRMVGVFGRERTNIELPRLWQGLVTGVLIGFMSGMIGIGGGIVLSPVILLMGWGDMKTTAAVSAPFIWVNSAAGMGGMLMSGISIDSDAFLMVAVVMIGGMLGGYMGSGRFSNARLKYMLAFVLAIACVKLFLV